MRCARSASISPHARSFARSASRACAQVPYPSASQGGGTSVAPGTRPLAVPAGSIRRRIRAPLLVLALPERVGGIFLERLVFQAHERFERRVPRVVQGRDVVEPFAERVEPRNQPRLRLHDALLAMPVVEPRAADRARERELRPPAPHEPELRGAEALAPRPRQLHEPLAPVARVHAPLDEPELLERDEHLARRRPAIPEDVAQHALKHAAARLLDRVKHVEPCGRQPDVL